MQSSERDDTELIDRLIRPFELFAQNKVAGAILLMLATTVAIVWANSPWSGSYNELWSTHAQLGLGGLTIDKPLLLWINDGLMAIFFFVVGLEIKREILAGELSTPRKAALPIAGAIGGMLVPAVIYALFNRGGPGAAGWGIPMATDIAFALGVLLLVGPRVPLSLKVFLTALAIVDDIGAIVVIAGFYTETIVFGSLIAGGAFLVMSAIANAVGVRSTIFYFAVGFCVWVAFLKSGIHATLASVLMAMTIPARTRIEGASLLDRVDGLVKGIRESGLPARKQLLTAHQQHALLEIRRTVEDGTAPLQELEHALLPLVTFVVMPIFALANAGVPIGAEALSAFSDPVFVGIVLGLFVGKQIGILGMCWLAVKLGFADLPSGGNWRQLHAVSILAGIGFTMSLFVASLAFPNSASQETAKVGILVASILSALVGAVLLSRSAKTPET